MIPKEIAERQKRLEQEIIGNLTPSRFNELALEIFKIQSSYCHPYKEYISLLGIDAKKITSVDKIPFLPITLFKNHVVTCFDGEPQALFASSTTTGTIPSLHYVKSTSLYQKSFTEGFQLFFGHPSNFTIVALLPSYLERENSSLIFMIQHLIEQSGKEESGFYLYNHQKLLESLTTLQKRESATILFGVTFALIDFAESHKIEFPSLKIFETGGMKGRKREIAREEVHSILKESFGVEEVGSEYGMAELLSQAWSVGKGIFETPPWMRVVIRDISDPFALAPQGKSGGVNIIDLANLYSCSFIESEDMGLKESDNGFKILGRLNNSQLRGCNLLLES